MIAILAKIAPASTARFATPARHIALMLAGAAVAGAAPALAEESAPPTTPARTVRLTPGETTSVPIDAAAHAVTVSRRSTVDVVKSEHSVELTGKKPGAAELVFEDDAGRVIEVVDVEVEPPSADLAEQLNSAMPGADIRVSDLGWGLLLQGEVISAEQAVAAERMAEDKAMRRVVANLVVRPQTVEFDVSLLEADADAVPESVGPFAAAPSELVRRVASLQEQGATRTLGESTLTTPTGAAASLRLSGEAPTETNARTAVVYQTYGVSLDFTPTMQASGALRLDVRGSSFGPDGQQALHADSIDLNEGESVVLTGLPSRLAGKADTSKAKALVLLVKPRVVKAQHMAAQQVRPAAEHVISAVPVQQATAAPSMLARLRHRLVSWAAAPVRLARATAHVFARHHGSSEMASLTDKTAPAER